MEKRVIRYIEKYRLFAPGERIVAAVSGGPDSIAMLYILLNLRRNWGIQIHLAHLNHMFRGEESQEEAEFVNRLAAKLGVTGTVENINVPAYIKKTGLSPEDAARRVRYSFLRKVAKEQKASVIATAHHANDQAETVLLHLLRGSGPEGLAAMAPREGDLVRPLLEVSREEIIKYCLDNRLEYRLDSSNQDQCYLRNKVRLKLVPGLKELNPQIVATLARTADICRLENDFLNQLVEEALVQVLINRTDGEAIVDLNRLLLFHPAIRRRAVRKLVDSFTRQIGVLSYRHTEMLLELSTGKKIFLPGGLSARRDYNRLTICFQNDKLSRDKKAKEAVPVPLTVPGKVTIPDFNIEVKAEIGLWPEERAEEGELRALFKPEILTDDLWIRARKAGDRFQPQGLMGTKKLKDFFIDEKIPRTVRDKIPLLVSGTKIIWIIGYRIAEGVSVTGRDKKALIIKVKKLPGV